MIDQLLEEIRKLQEAHSLLEKLYYEIGPYKLHEIIHKNYYSNEDANSMINNLDRYFDFDDSE